MKVAIAGYGVEGESSYNYWKAKGAQITVFDSNPTPVKSPPKDAEIITGDDAFEKIQGFDLVIRTASLPPKKIVTDAKIWSATNEFFAQCPAPIIGVTGTKGKGTTCSLIAQMLKNDGGRTVHLLGNIGVPALDVLPSIQPDDIVVFELSSFQLWDIQKSPETAVVLLIEPDHLDVHASMEEYVNAKANIAKFQDEEDLLVYHPNNEHAAHIAKQSAAHKKRYMTSEGAYEDGGQIIIDGVAVCLVSEVALVGGHNIENVCAALTAAWKYTQNITALKAAITSFSGLPHRLEYVREVNGVKIYNDSYSSAPTATMAAIRAFTEPEILICGGYSRGLSFNNLAQAIADQKNVKMVLLIGQTARNIADALLTANFEQFQIIDGDLKQCVMHAKSLAQPGDVILFSPGCPSFDMFANFKERGEQFKQIVEAL